MGRVFLSRRFRNLRANFKLYFAGGARTGCRGKNKGRIDLHRAWVKALARRPLPLRARINAKKSPPTGGFSPPMRAANGGTGVKQAKNKKFAFTLVPIPL